MKAFEKKGGHTAGQPPLRGPPDVDRCTLAAIRIGRDLNVILYASERTF